MFGCLPNSCHLIIENLVFLSQLDLCEMVLRKFRLQDVPHLRKLLFALVLKRLNEVSQLHVLLFARSQFEPKLFAHLCVFLLLRRQLGKLELQIRKLNSELVSRRSIVICKAEHRIAVLFLKVSH